MRLPWKKKRGPRPRFEIQAGAVAHNTRLWMDGKDISHWVTGYTVEAEVGSLTKVTLSLIPEEVRIRMPRPVRMKYVTTGEDGVTREVTL
jgi:hypothetical protein